MGVDRFYQSLSEILSPMEESVRVPCTRPVYFKHAKYARVLSRYGTLCVDLNTLLYGAARKARDNEHFLHRVDAILWKILKHYEVTGSVMLALDGPGPRAKLLLQRKRRLQRSDKDERSRAINDIDEGEEIPMLDDEDDEDVLFESEVGEKGEPTVAPSVKNPAAGIDANQFTPGTRLMDEIKDRACEISERALEKCADQYASATFTISGADQAGEGEYKCFWHMLEYFETERKRTPNRRPRALVIGGDSDLILFALQASHLGDIDVLGLDTSYSGTLYHVNAIRKALLSQFPYAVSPQQQQGIIDDFCFLALLSGNDFVPKLRGYNFVNAWGEYVRLKQSLSSESGYIVRDLKAFSVDEVDVSGRVNMSLLRRVLQRSAVNAEFDLILAHPKTFFVTLFSRYGPRPVQNVKQDALPEGELRGAPLESREELAAFESTQLEDGSWKCDLFVRADQHSEPLHIGSGIAPRKRIAESMAADNALTVRQQELRAFLSLDCDITWNCTLEDYLANRDDVLRSLFGTESSLFIPTANLDIASPASSFSDKKQELHHYLRGILWTMHYLRCQCCDPNYYYPFSAPNSKTVVESKDKVANIAVRVHPTPFKEMLSPLEFCVAILPPDGRHHVPVEEVAKLLDPDFDHGAKELFHGTSAKLRLEWLREDSLARLRAAVANQLSSSMDNPGLNHTPISMQFQPPVVVKRILDKRGEPTITRIPGLEQEMVRRHAKTRNILARGRHMRSHNAAGRHQHLHRPGTKYSAVRQMCTWMRNYLPLRIL